MEYQITDDIEKLMAVLPDNLAYAIEQIGSPDDLIEIVVDLGRLPTARYINRTEILSDRETTHADIEYIVSRLGGFDADNRGGIERTLHRISAIRNRNGDIVGLTCRVGRAVYGTIDIIEDIIRSGRSVLILGAPGVGKTTMLREAARILANTRRVVIVDTSNEIGGDGDIPHPAIGLSRRMQVAQPTLQHEVMIEAVENHNPQVIIIDEIGRELEAQAARTIAERGVQLIGTAHGNTLENLMRNPTLSDLIGGIQSVTLSDEEARRRRTQKTVLERRAPPTFDVLIEVQDRHRMVIHHDLALAVDSHLRGQPVPAELRYRDENDVIRNELVIPILDETSRQSGGLRSADTHYVPIGNLKRGRASSQNETAPYYRTVSNGERQSRQRRRADMIQNGQHEPHSDQNENFEVALSKVAVRPSRNLPMMRIYAYGMGHNRIIEMAKQLNVPIEMVEDMRNADVLVTIKTYYRRRPKLILDAERRNIPIHVLRANTDTQVENFLIDLFQLDTEQTDDPFEAAMEEVRQAIMRIREGVESVDLTPQAAHIRRRQHEAIRAENLASHSYGREPKRYVRVFREEIN
ncbi:MAG: AAA family ATPase [Phototrophicales bacterium]|nr:MAG: AAA family ATPase [Phototrophicales bacterium]